MEIVPGIVDIPQRGTRRPAWKVFMLYARLLISSCCFMASTACAVNTPPLETGPVQVNSRLADGQQLEIRDAASGAYLCAFQQMTLLKDINPALAHSVVLQSQPTGADLIVTLRNATNVPQPVGSFSVGIFNLGPTAEYFDLRNSSVAHQVTSADFPSFSSHYPNDAYAPVMVLRNQDVVFGVSLNYPVMEYKHDALVGMCSPPAGFAEGPAGRGYMVGFTLSSPPDAIPQARVTYQAVIPAGESRTYTICVRTTHDRDNWVTTLLPYRDYFRSLYGGAQYTRRTRPVRGANTSSGGLCSTSNPYGFGRERPDLNGWAESVAQLGRDRFSSTMIWTLSGWYRNHPENNFPYLVASQLRTTPPLATAFDAATGFPSLARNGRELGVWWGRSLQVTHGWDTAESTPFDPFNADHAAAALREMQAIHDLGATVVGLDTFCHVVTPIWKTIPWMRDMQARFPGVSFVVEPSMCDIMHTIAANWVDGYGSAHNGVAARTVADVYYLNGPDVLADFLVPGHETWASIGYDIHRSQFHLDPSPAYIVNDIRRYASYGYVPLVFAEVDCPTDIQAAPTWETSLPTSIVNNDPYIANLRRGLLPGATPPPAPPNPPAPVPTQPPAPTPTPPPGPTPAPTPTPPPAPTPTPGGGSGGNGSNGNGSQGSNGTQPPAPPRPTTPTPSPTPTPTPTPSPSNNTPPRNPLPPAPIPPRTETPTPSPTPGPTPAPAPTPGASGNGNVPTGTASGSTGGNSAGSQPRGNNNSRAGAMLNAQRNQPVNRSRTQGSGLVMRGVTPAGSRPANGSGVGSGSGNQPTRVASTPRTGSTASTPRPSTSGGTGSQPATQIPITVTQRFNQALGNAVVAVRQADRTQGLLALIRRIQEREREAQAPGSEP